VLWTIDATQEALTLKAVTLPKLRVDLEHLRELKENDDRYHSELVLACKGELSETRALLGEAMGLSSTPWYRHPALVAGVSFAVGVITTVVVARSL